MNSPILTEPIWPIPLAIPPCPVQLSVEPPVMLNMWGYAWLQKLLSFPQPTRHANILRFVAESLSISFNIPFSKSSWFVSHFPRYFPYILGRLLEVAINSKIKKVAISQISMRIPPKLAHAAKRHGKKVSWWVGGGSGRASFFHMSISISAVLSVVNPTMQIVCSLPHVCLIGRTWCGYGLWLRRPAEMWSSSLELLSGRNLGTLWHIDAASKVNSAKSQAPTKSAVAASAASALGFPRHWFQTMGHSKLSFTLW